MKTRHKIMSFLLSGAMVFSLLPASAIGTVKAASVNYALTATATASGSETSAFGPEKAKDGDATTKTSRWASEERDASESNPHWLAMDLCEVKTVNSVIITWERRNPTNYAIETSEDGSTWKAVKTFTSAPAEKEQIINLDNPVQTRYIRVRINTFNPTAEGITWKTVSIYEFGVYGEKQSSGSEVWDALNNLTVKAGDKKLNLPTVEGGKVEAYADYEQIIDTDGTIYQPLEDKTVSVEFKVTDQNNKVTKKEIAITVPGTHTATADENAKPAVLPELAEWAATESTDAKDSAEKSRAAAEKAKQDAEAAKAAAEESAEKAETAKEEIQESADQIQKNATEIDSLKEDLDNVNETLLDSIFVESKNRYNKATSIIGTINMQGDVREDASSMYLVSDYILLKSGKIYALSYYHTGYNK